MANGNRKFLNVQGAFFEETPQGLAAVGDPETLGQLISGQLEAEEADASIFQQKQAAPQISGATEETQEQFGLEEATPTQPQDTGGQAQQGDTMNIGGLDVTPNFQFTSIGSRAAPVEGAFGQGQTALKFGAGNRNRTVLFNPDDPSQRTVISGDISDALTPEQQEFLSQQGTQGGRVSEKQAAEKGVIELGTDQFGNQVGALPLELWSKDEMLNLARSPGFDEQTKRSIIERWQAANESQQQTGGGQFNPDIQNIASKFSVNPALVQKLKNISDTAGTKKGTIQGNKADKIAKSLGLSSSTQLFEITDALGGDASAILEEIDSNSVLRPGDLRSDGTVTDSSSRSREQQQEQQPQVPSTAPQGVSQEMLNAVQEANDLTPEQTNQVFNLAQQQNVPLSEAIQQIQGSQQTRQQQTGGEAATQPTGPVSPESVGLSFQDVNQVGEGGIVSADGQQYRVLPNGQLRAIDQSEAATQRPANVNNATYNAVKNANNLSDEQTNQVFNLANQQSIPLSDAVQQVKSGQAPAPTAGGGQDTGQNVPDPSNVSVPDPSQTPTGAGVSQNTGMSVNDYTSMVESALSDEIATLEGDIDSVRQSITDMLKGRDTFEIISEELERQGVKKKMNLAEQYDEMIRKQTKRIRELPGDIRETLEDQGVTQAQLNRITTKELQEPQEVLRDLMEKKGVVQESVNQAMDFVNLYTDARIKDRAARLKAFEFELEEAEGDMADLEEDQKTVIQRALDERKTLFGFAQSAIENGASQEVVNFILNAESQAQALSAYAGMPTSEASDFEIRSGPDGSIVAVNPNTLETRMVMGSGGGGDTTTQNEEPLSPLDIKRVEELYGFAPPLGATMSQVTQFMQSNPNATAAELQEGINDMFAEQGGQSDRQFLSKSYIRSVFDMPTLQSISNTGSLDINNMLDTIMQRVEVARQEGFSDQEILNQFNTMI